MSCCADDDNIAVVGPLEPRLDAKIRACDGKGREWATEKGWQYVSLPSFLIKALICN